MQFSYLRTGRVIGNATSAEYQKEGVPPQDYSKMGHWKVLQG